MAEEKFTAEAVKKAFESGDGKSIAALAEEGHTARVESINPQVQKFVASAVLDLAGYEPPAVVKSTTNKTMAVLDNILAILGDKATPDVKDAIAKQKAEASTTFVASDGVQKGWQAFVLDCIAEHFELKLKKPKIAKAIRDCLSSLVINGPKRPMTKAEKAAWKKAKKEEEGGDSEEEE